MFGKILIFILCVATLIALLGVLPIHGETDLYKSVVRLHVLANSDSEVDQALKLKVRDAILEEGEELFGAAKDSAEAKAIIKENLSVIEAVATEVIGKEGFDYKVSVMLGEEEYPTKNYESLCFPSGKYISLRVLIGEGEGQNWWCVLFPPLCLSAASKSDDAFAQVGLNKDQYNIITESEKPKYKARFKILEAFGDILN